MKLRIILKAFNKQLITSTLKELSLTLLNNKFILKSITLPKVIKRFCVLRSPHIDEDSREHFEIHIYKEFFDISITSPLILNKLLQTSIPSGVLISIKELK